KMMDMKKETKSFPGSFSEFGINTQVKLIKLNHQINRLKEELHLFIEVYGISNDRTLSKSQELDAKLNELSRIL
ncbi:MAG: Spo0E like sporulation regulatory protein, partial [Clostridiales bacterium]|nr:Spo0E like sporulation regulatory protein [Clostridiales bacterium]